MRFKGFAVIAAGAVAVLTASCSSDGGGDPETSAPPATAPPTTAAPATSAPPSSSGSSRPSAAADAALRAGTPTVLADDLEVPWGIAFLPDGSALVSERDTHEIVRVTADGDTDDIGSVPGVGGGGEGGLLGLAVSPRFASDRTVFAYYTTDRDNRVVRFRYADGRLSGFTPVITGIPAAGIHNGGRIQFGPDGYLYVTAGDAAQAERAPDDDYLGGKVLRMTAAGKPAPGNPDPSSVVFTKGHRNPQGIAFAPDGALYEAEFGQNTEDEVNLLRAGADYGWPAVEGDNGSASGKTAPLATFSTSDASPSGLAYAGRALWMAGLGGEKLFRIPVTARGEVGEPQTLFDGDYGRLRTVVVAPDGALWVTTSNRDGRGSPRDDDDKIIRIPLER